MSLALRLAAIALITLAVLAFAWGIWVVSTPDYQGGRHFAGGLILAAGVIMAIVGVIAAISARRVDSRLPRPSPRARC